MAVAPGNLVSTLVSMPESMALQIVRLEECVWDGEGAVGKGGGGRKKERERGRRTRITMCMAVFSSVAVYILLCFVGDVGQVFVLVGFGHFSLFLSS